ncbi:MAG: polyprenyl diphosphate synthase, partial [Allosphingosinicella sp.]
MDGNGRWAKARGLPRAAGHRQGAEAARQVLRAAGEAGVECLTLYAFSSENWRRPQDEINDLMGLLRFYITRELDALHREGVRLRILGDLSAFQPDIAKLVEQALDRTAGNRRMTLAIALSYGARTELVQAARKLAGRVAAGDIGFERLVVAQDAEPNALAMEAVELALDGEAQESGQVADLV